MATTGYAEFLETMDLLPLAGEDLSPEEVAELNQHAAEMGHVPRPDVHEDAAWSEEIVRRVQDLRAGRVQTISAEGAFARAQARVRGVGG